MVVYGTKTLIVSSKNNVVGLWGGKKSSTSAKLLRGNGSISGRVLENGLPVSRRVMLYDRATGAYAGQTRSDSNGLYSFNNTNERGVYFVVSIDDHNDGVQFNLKGQDLISGNHDNISFV